jgi:hypothetical protein
MSNSTTIPGWRGVAALANNYWLHRHGYLTTKLPSLVRGAPRGLWCSPYQHMPSLTLRFSRKNNGFFTPILSICAQVRWVLDSIAPLETAFICGMVMKTGCDGVFVNVLVISDPVSLTLDERPKKDPGEQLGC